MRLFLFACLLAGFALPARADSVMAIVSSDASEWVGQGQSLTYTPANATFSISGTNKRLQLRVVGGDGKTWDLRLKAPFGSTLRPKQYWFPEREGFETGRAASMDFSGDGRACDDIYGDFEIRQIGFDALGRVNMLEATLLQYCSPDAKPLAMVVMYRAPRLNFGLNSTEYDWIGQNIDYVAYGDTSTFWFDGGYTGANIQVEGMGVNWSLWFSTPSTVKLQKGVYLTVPDGDGVSVFMDFAGNSRGGSMLPGKLEILSVTYDTNNRMTQISARYWFYDGAERTKLVRSGNFNLWK